ncbi:cell envelope integrity protein TolA [Hydrogenophaga sp. R2]|uniref:cell envelope integrity protein TolA n=1 Tax=Hydrogenophaga sp. R2 TaxID=3132827 RepID=UPI003CF9246A
MPSTSTFAHSTLDRSSLAPPRADRWGPPVAKAVVVHGLLIIALTWGVQWNKDVELATVEAELWSRVPQQAAPRAVEPPPPPPAPPAPQPRPEPRPAPPPPGPTEAEIATAKAREKAEADKREAERRAAEKREAERKAAAEKERQQKLAEDKKRAEAEKREAQLKEQLRQDQLRRMMGQAGATGGPQSSGTAQQSSGPTPGYGAKVAARIKPNVVFTDVAPGNPRAEVEVRTLPDGTITGRKLIKSSGNAAWDEAVLRAIDRTGSLPRDTDGRVPPSLVIGLRPLD